MALKNPGNIQVGWDGFELYLPLEVREPDFFFQDLDEGGFLEDALLGKLPGNVLRHIILKVAGGIFP